jgi:hypothetical protein
VVDGITKMEVGGVVGLYYGDSATSIKFSFPAVFEVIDKSFNVVSIRKISDARLIMKSN